MDLLLEWAPAVVLILITALMIWRDPRRMRCAVFVGLSLSAVALTLSPSLFRWLEDIAGDDAPYVLLGVLGLGLLLVLGVSVFLIWAGVVLIVREGFSVAHSLSLVLGVATLGSLALVYTAAVDNTTSLIAYLLMLMFPMALFGFALFSFLAYSALYGAWAKRWATPGQVVVVLGSGLIGDRVPPLLARRIDLGVEMYAKSLRRWPEPLLIMSGGKGGDELISEAEGMGKYVLARGLPQVEGAEAELALETESASTEENVRFSRALALERDLVGPWMAVTSDFHAFRAAMLLSREGIKGNAVGARTAAYFWPSAKLREFIAILASTPRWTVTFAVLSALPLALTAVIDVFSLLGG